MGYGSKIPGSSSAVGHLVFPSQIDIFGVFFNFRGKRDLEPKCCTVINATTE